MNERAVAIVGASCRFPGAAGLEAFWRLLIDGVDAVTEIGPERWSTRFFYHPSRGEPGKSYSWAAGLIDGIDLFEPGFFGISPREAAEMDPQQRLLLELAWHALEDAGIPAARIAGSATGVYVGASSTDYGNLRLGDPASAGPHFVSGMSLGILANRLSHFFDLRGPTQVIDTACSSSLVALHEACEALRSGRIETALVGGVNLLLSPYPFIGFAQAGMLSPRGRCFAFDARADGYVRAEGGAVVVLKPLARALAEGDLIRAVICGTAVGASGRTMGLSLPSAAAQAELLRGVYRDAGIAAETLAFIEIHGTGTPAGDPAEAEAVGRVLGQARQAPLPIGSVKTNIGHLEPASGIAGLLKAMLALEHGVLPRSLYGETPNPAIAFAHLNLRLVGAAEPIGSGRYAGINSFGFGGSNAHAILAPPLRREEAEAEDAAHRPLMISARGGASLRALAESWRETIAVTPATRRPSIVRAAARRRDQHTHRLVVLGDDPASSLDNFLAGRPSRAVVSGTAMREEKLAFVYSGNGAQFLGMGRVAYLAGGAFPEAIAEADRALHPYLGWSVEQRIAGAVTDEELRRADIAQPMLFAIQVAITHVLRDMGAVPSGFVGHSVGEIAAAWAAGALSLDMAARIVVTRSRHQERTRGTGRMAVLALGPDDAAAMLHEVGDALEIAAINSARSVTIAGPGDAIGRLGEMVAQRGIAWRSLDLDFAFHSDAMEPIRNNLIAELDGIRSSALVSDLVSTVTGARVAEGALDASHWWRNVRDPVRFSDAIETLIADDYRLFVEIGPNPVLLSYLRDALHTAAPSGKVLATLERRDPPGDPFPAIAARLHVAGHDMDRGAWFDGRSDPRGLPLYPWQRERCWFGKTIEAAEPTNPSCDHLLLGFRQPGAAISWVNHLDTALFPFLADHRVDGTPVLPAAAIIDMALAAARTQHPDAAVLELRDVELLRPLGFDRGAREAQSTLLPDGTWQFASRKRLADEPMTVHATGRLGVAAQSGVTRRETRGDVHKIVSGAALYRRASRLGLDYGETFRIVKEVLQIDGGRAAARLQPTSARQDWLIDPFLLDGAFQALFALMDDDASEEAGFLPRRFGRVTAVAPFGRVVDHAELRLVRRGVHSVAADIVLYDLAGNSFAELRECWFSRISLQRAATESCLRTELLPAPLAPPPLTVFDGLGETLTCVVAARQRNLAREREQALLLEALLAAIGRETADVAELEALGPLGRRFAGEELPESGELWRSLLADHPEMVAELTLTAMLRDAQPIDATAPTIAALRRTSPSAAAGRAIVAAALDAIALEWPREQPLRIYESGSVRLSNRLCRGGTAVTLVDMADPCDLALFPETGMPDPSQINLAPGGALLAVMPRPNPLWELVGGLSDWRAELAAAGLDEIGAVAVSDGPWPCEVIWARARGQPAAPASFATLLSLALISGAGDADFAAALAALGHRLTEAEEPNDAIVFAVCNDDGPDAASHLIPQFARRAALAAEQRVPLWLVTMGVHQAAEGWGLCGAALWGFGRVLRNETSGLVLRMVDLPPDMPWAERAQRLTEELVAPDGESEIVWTKRGRHVVRLRRGLPTIWTRPDDVIAASASPGRFEWMSTRLAAPKRGEITIEVRAAGLNFRDVMIAAGALPEEALLDGFAGAALGLECAGIVSAVGDGVTSLAIGDRVMGFAPAALASRVVTSAHAVVAMPSELDFAAAATLPVAFVTARYSLVMLARLAPGETVLIHAASGGVGLAAIQVAKACGATVIATAGSPTKRAFLRMVGADHVCDSRELRFVAAVREVTGGVGVDVVLNSLPGDAMEASLDLLKPFGRFVELGKRDFYENRRFGARPLRQNISYFAVDIDQLPERRPELAKLLLAEIAAALAAGEIRPLAHRCFAFAGLSDAFRLMQATQHIGKLVLVPDGNAGVAVSRKPELLLRRDGVHIVTGGLDGFGFVAARWLAERGTDHLALISRRGRDTPGAAQRIAELEALGAKITAYAADVADPRALNDVLEAVRGHGVPIRGVVHAAAAIVDGTAAALTAADITGAMSAKVLGALHLDRLTRDDPLDLFWLFSSATTIIGAPGQGAYVAANAALEALARRRQAQAKPALAIAWGPIADAGTLAARPDERAALSRRLGVRSIPAMRALAGLPAMVASGLPVVAFADLAPLESDHALPIVAERLFDDLRTAGIDTATDEVLFDRLAALGSVERCELLTAIVADAAARILRLPEGSLNPHRALAELGMDSLMAIELRLALEARLRLDVPLMSLADGASAATIAARLAEMIERPGQTTTIAQFALRHEMAADTDLAAED